MLRCLLWGAFQEVKVETRFTKPGCREYRPRFWLVSMLLEMSVAKQVKKKSTSRVHRTSWWGGTAKKPSFRSYNSPVADTHLISLSRYWFIVICNACNILMRELENGVTRKMNQNFHRLVSILPCHSLIKGCLTLLRTHFTWAYGALDTLPNHYY